VSQYVDGMTPREIRNTIELVRNVSSSPGSFVVGRTAGHAQALGWITISGSARAYLTPAGLTAIRVAEAYEAATRPCP
jgi:hypothetical protein